MNLAGTITFEGSNSLRWLQKHIDGMIHFVFDNQDEEFVLAIEQGLFKTMLKMMSEFDGEGTHSNPSDKAGRVKPDCCFWLEDDDADIEVELSEDRNCTPVLGISNRKGHFSLSFNEAQAKEIEDRCRKLNEIRNLEREVQERKTITAIS